LQPITPSVHRKRATKLDGSHNDQQSRLDPKYAMLGHSEKKTINMLPAPKAKPKCFLYPSCEATFDENVKRRQYIDNMSFYCTVFTACM